MFQKKIKFTFLFLFLNLIFISCGNISFEVPESTSTSESVGTSDTVYIFATDYTSSGQLYVASYTDSEASLANLGLTQLGSSAIIKKYDSSLYILHDGYSTVSTDNLQVIDLENNYEVTAQYSTGNGSNPHDVVVTNNRAFISLYNPSAEEYNITAEGKPADIIEINIDNGRTIGRYSFEDFLNDDGDLNANADKMILIGNTLYVLLQDLDSTTFAASSNGLLGMIDIENREVIGVIELNGRNPVSLATNSNQDKIFISFMATYDFSLGNFNTDEPYGGIEVIDIDSQTSEAFIDDDIFNGYIEFIQIYDDKLYILSSSYDSTNFTYTSKLSSITTDFTDFESELEIIEEDESDIRSFAIENDHLWISRRINESDSISSPSIDVFSLSSNEILGTVEPVTYGMSMAY